MIAALVFVPALAGLTAFFLRSPILTRSLLVGTAVAHSIMVGCTWIWRPAMVSDAWWGLDAAGLLFLSITSLLFLIAAVYGWGFLQQEAKPQAASLKEEFLFTNAPEAVFIGGLLMFLSAMTLVTVCRHLGLLWVAVEATTLASARLIYFHRHPRSLEATWKYLLVCSVGIALALLGNFFLSVSALTAGSDRHSVVLEIDPLLAHAANLQVPWLKASFILILVGYGTKMGLAPMHTWLPDAHSESPSLVSALLSGAVLNCAFLGVLRFYQICIAAGQAAFAQDLLVLLGILSMGVAAVFILGQTDYKRLLAYSSVEHMGILALGVGLGGAGAFGSVFHALNHSLAKAMLFLVAGNFLTVYQSKSIDQVRGVLRILPLSGWLWIAGFLALTGTPPFGPFFSEFTILRAAFEQGREMVAVVYLALLALIFIGMATAFLRMAQGSPRPEQRRNEERLPWCRQYPPALLGTLVLALGVYLPASLRSFLHEVAALLGGA
jgi:hydrogenase-4 component F